MAMASSSASELQAAASRRKEASGAAQGKNGRFSVKNRESSAQGFSV